MDHLPTGTILVIVLVDVLLVCGLSALFGAAIARAVGRSVVLGGLLGLVVPVVGPLGLLAVAVARDPALMSRQGSRGARTWVAVGLLGAAAVGFLLATPLAWGDVSGAYEGYSLATDASPADSIVGAVATVGSAILLGLLGVSIAIWSGRRRVGVLAGFVAGAWLLVTIDSVLVLRSLDGLADNVSGASAGAAWVDATAAGGLWLSLAAAVLTLAAAVLLVTRGDEAPASSPQPETPQPASLPGWGGGESWGSPATPGTGTTGGWGGSPASQWGDDDRGRTTW